jgi:hypothetical protein
MSDIVTTVITPASCLGNAHVSVLGLETGYLDRFYVVLLRTGGNAGMVHTLEYNHYMPHSFQFIMHY